LKGLRASKPEIFLVPGGGEGYQHQPAGPNERTAREGLTGLIPPMGETARLAQSATLS
jgi:hypothetical protein